MHAFHPREASGPGAAPSLSLTTSHSLQPDDPCTSHSFAIECYRESTTNGTPPEVESWDNAFELDTPLYLEQILDQLQHTFSRSPLSEVSEQSDYFQPHSHNRHSQDAISAAGTLAVPKWSTGFTKSSANGVDGSSPTTGVRSNYPLDGIPPLSKPYPAARNYPTVGVVAPADPSHVPCTHTQTYRPSPHDDRASSSSSSTPSITPSMPLLYDRKRRPILPHKSSEESPAQTSKPMTTITQEMMLSHFSDYTGIVTRINPIKRVAAWVDDLDDLEVPELQDLDFNKVRSTLAKLQSPPTALESVGSWDTESESSSSVGGGSISRSQQEEDRSDDLEFPRRPAHLKESSRLESESGVNDSSSPLHESPELLSMDRVSDFEMKFEFIGPKASVGNERLSPVLVPEGPVIKQPLFISHSPVASETPAFGEGPSHQEDQEAFWDDLDIGDESFVKGKGWNRNVVNRAVISGRGGGLSRIQREVVPLKEFIALPSRIPRLCRAPGDTSRPVTPAATLSRAISSHIEIPHRTISSKSSLPRLKRPCTASKSLLGGQFPSPSLLGGPSPAPSTTLVSQASASSVGYVSSSRRSSLQSRDGLPSFKTSSLAMHLVSFIDQQDVQSKESQAVQPKKEPLPPKTRPNQGSSGFRSLLELRFFTNKLDFGRARFFSRTVPPIPEPPVEYSSTIETLQEQPSMEDDVSTPGQESISDVPSRTLTGSTAWDLDAGNDYYSLSRKTINSNHRSAPTNDDSTNGPERIPRRLFLKRSTKPSVFGDGSELDQLDNLPIFDLNGYREDHWSPKPRVNPLEQIQTQLDDKPNASIEETQRSASPTEESTMGEPTSSSMIRRSRSLRKSLFDIFGPNQGTSEDTNEKSKRRSIVGPTLIRYLSQSKLRTTPETGSNRNDEPWRHDNDTQDRQETTQENEHYFSRPRRPFVHPASPPHSIPSSFHPLGATNRPALISNMNQYMKKPRGQPHAVGKMIFDHDRMCWVINPDYLMHKRRHVPGDTPSPELDETWGDEPNVFADLSDDSDSSPEEDEVGSAEIRGLGFGAANSFDSRNDHGLTSQLWSLRRPSQECSVSNDPLTNTWRPGSSMDGPEDRPSGSIGHTIIPKSSRKSLSAGHFGGFSNGVGGGGYSSRGEFEVGTEFDITVSLLEQCMQAEAQHRKEAGKFFALPCGPSPQKKKLARKASANLLRLPKASNKNKPVKVAEPIADYEGQARSTVHRTPGLPSLTKSWPLRSKTKPASPTTPTSIEELIQSPVKKPKEIGHPITLSPTPEPLNLPGEPLRRTFGRASLLATLRAKPSAFHASTMAERGPARTRHSHCGALPFSATLAIAQRGRTMTRGGIPTPWHHSAFEPKRSSFDKMTEMDRIQEEKDDYIDRGYRLLSTARGRPPLLSQMELLRQFEECATKYHRRQRIGKLLIE